MNIKRAELHLHTSMSTMDAITTPEEYLKTANIQGLGAIALTDHASVQGFLQAYNAVKKSKNNTVKLIYGNEVYLEDDKMPSGKKQTHATVLALNKIGIKNLYRLVTLSNTQYFNKVPCTPKSLLTQHREGLLVGSGCSCGELYTALANGKSDRELEELAMFYDYIEIVPIGNFATYGFAGRDDLIKINIRLAKLGEKLGKPVVAVSDAHYAGRADAICRRIIQKHEGSEDYKNQPDLSLKTTEALLCEFEYLGSEKAKEIVVTNPAMIAAMADDTFAPYDTDAQYVSQTEKLEALVEKKAREKYGSRIHPHIRKRLDFELSAIRQNSLTSYDFLVGAELVGRAVELGEHVGNRGAVASSLAAYLIGITRINPLEAHYLCSLCCHTEFHTEYGCGVDMPDKLCKKCGIKMKKDGFTVVPEMFFGYDGEKHIDIDYNFSPEYRSEAIRHLEQFTHLRTVRCGTVSTIPLRKAIKMTDSYCETEEPGLDRVVRNVIAEKLSSVKQTNGHHPGRTLLIPEGKDTSDYTPLDTVQTSGGEKITVTHFDFGVAPLQYSPRFILHSIDILEHNDMQMLKRLEELTGVKSDDIPLDDIDTMKLFSNGNTLGINEFSGTFVRKNILPLVKPGRFDDLIRISGLSHGTGVWTSNGEHLFRNGMKISEITSCRDDVMLELMKRGLDRKSAYTVSEQIRKGRGLSDSAYSALCDMGMKKIVLDSWNKIRYSFPRGHAATYVLFAFKIAYYKVHFPLEFYCAYFSAYAQDTDADLFASDRNFLAALADTLTDKLPWYDQSRLVMAETCLEVIDAGYGFELKSTAAGSDMTFEVGNGKILYTI